MKIAIHHRPGSFSDRWIEYCKEKGIEYKIVNAYDSDIVDQVKGCEMFMWHHNHGDYRDALFAKQLLYSLEEIGLKVFPDWHTTWFFDDKVGQKYLLEAIGASLVPSYVFYTKKEALNWHKTASFPKVFKLRGGAGAANVKLVRTRREAKKLINRAFGKGFSQFDRIGYFKERFCKWRQGQDTILGVAKGMGRLIIPTTFAKMYHREKGYVYFQDFIPNNYYDIRVIVIGNKAFSIKRLVRKNDFRASGSGNIIYDRTQLSEPAIADSFRIARKINSQCMGFDYVFAEGKPIVVEMGYGFGVHGYDECEGYWTDDMVFHPGFFNPQEWIIQDLMS